MVLKHFCTFLDSESSTYCSNAVSLLQFSSICASVVSYMAFVLSLFALYLFFSCFLRKAVFRDCGISWVLSLLLIIIMIIFILCVCVFVCCFFFFFFFFFVFFFKFQSESAVVYRQWNLWKWHQNCHLLIRLLPPDYRSVIIITTVDQLKTKASKRV